jgi:hypothetical protein
MFFVNQSTLIIIRDSCDPDPLQQFQNPFYTQLFALDIPRLNGLESWSKMTACGFDFAAMLLIY